jgi:multidrug efflux pump subunit AcrB
MTAKAISNRQGLVDVEAFIAQPISGVVREAVIAGALTGLLILLFLGS